ncbi:response regulator transcription factor [Polaribacter sp. Hel1_85]|uniref:response regulator transcription factor n=1 Tax=Polaribacter sp. Hel1_85 TaxID=1250005 RepID=UPI000569F24F|nr:response regulator transcription factor [Polaribacter sp. Hel1_85]
MEKKIKLFIVDDHKMFLEGIQSILIDTQFIDVIATAKDGKEALKLLNNFLPDIIITDIDMPNLDGIELTKLVKKQSDNIKIIAVSSHSEGEVISKAIKAGINGYILKNTGKTELLKAIKQVYKGENYYTEEVKKNLNDSLFNPTKAKNQIVKISSREKEVLKLISEEMNTQEIAEELFISPNTVEVHRKNLMRKIGTKNMVGLVKYAIQQGIIK